MQLLADVSPTWQALRRLGQSKIATATVFMPLIGYLVLLNEHVLEILTLSPQLLGIESTGAPDYTTIQSLRYLYLGLASIGLASLVYRISCPREVQEHSDEYTYIAHELDVMSPGRFDRTKKMLLAFGVGGGVTEEWIARIANADVSIENSSEGLFPQSASRSVANLPWKQWADQNKPVFTDTLSARYTQLNGSRTIARLFVTSFYFIGFALLVRPSASVLMSIVSATVRDIS